MTPFPELSRSLRHPKPIKPQAGQKSVWDYPRPPRVESQTEPIVVKLAGQVIVNTTDAARGLETSYPPVYDLPMTAFPNGRVVAYPPRFTKR